jgi:hypothetical protein
VIVTRDSIQSEPHATSHEWRSNKEQRAVVEVDHDDDDDDTVWYDAEERLVY